MKWLHICLVSLEGPCRFQSEMHVGHGRGAAYGASLSDLLAFAGRNPILSLALAGLTVAIPALFGYNYLAARIKNISSDMGIFVDEFVTRVAETHGAR